jgi:hypothetical protein
LSTGAAERTVRTGLLQGISSIRGPTARQHQKKGASNQDVMSQFQFPTHPNREFFAALQGI